MAGCPGCHLASWSLQVRGPYVFEVSLFFKRWCLDGVSEPPVVELRVSRLPEATQICSPNHPQSQLLNTRVLQHPTMAARTKYVPFVSPGLFRSDKNKEYQHRSILHREHRGSTSAFLPQPGAAPGLMTIATLLGQRSRCPPCSFSPCGITTKLSSMCLSRHHCSNVS